MPTDVLTRNADKVQHASRLKYRGIHFDLNGMIPTFERLMHLLEIIAASRYNLILMQWEDMFPWSDELGIRSPHAYTPKQVRMFMQAAKELGIEIVPLVQTMGHMEMVLKHPQYAHLREIPKRTDTINVLLGDSKRLISQMIDEVLCLCGPSRQIYLGGDEAWCFGQGPSSREFLGDKDLADLYMHHVQFLHKKMSALGIEIVFWGDMIAEWSTRQISDLSKMAQICAWGYYDLHFSHERFHTHSINLKKFVDCGVKLSGCCAYKGVDDPTSDIPVLVDREKNIRLWLELAERYKIETLIASGWSRWGTNRVLCDPIDVSLESLIIQGLLMDKDYETQELKESVTEILGSELKAYCLRQKVMEDLSEARKLGWQHVRLARELIAMIQTQPDRCGTGVCSDHQKWLGEIIEKIESIAKTAVPLWRGVVIDGTMEQYFTERVNPLKLEREDIFRHLDALGIDEYEL